MDEVLASVERWPVEAAAVGVTDEQATRAVHGPTTQERPWASVTKLLTAWACLVAVQDDAVHLDEPAGPDGSTVRHLLAHASGLGPDAEAPASRAGARRVYSNHGFEVLAELVSTRVGTDFADHVTVEVTEPLGMTATHLPGSPAHGGVGSLADLLRLGRELLEPSLLDEPLATLVAQPAFPGLPGVLPGYGRQPDNAWGLGVEIRNGKRPHWTGPSQPPETFGHFGQSGSFLWVDRGAGVATACLAGRDFGSWARQAWAPFNEQVWQAVQA